MAEKRLYEAIKYTFGPTEMRELGESLAHENQNCFNLEDQKANTVAALAAAIKSAKSRVVELTTKINNGYEMREVECLAILETPRPGMKRIIRLDTNEMVREEAMTVNEMQSGFGFIAPGPEAPGE
ncbi:MAG TPA: hypothetical protein VE030_11035 [Burkholderiales bacterium]|nr:hypothetical protein [Burkholderiales bacterium]